MLLAGCEHIGVGLLDGVLLVGDVAVIGDHHPIESVRCSAVDLLRDRVHRVVAVLGVDVVVAGQPAVSSGIGPAGAGRLRGGRSGDGAAEQVAADRRDAQQAQPLKELTAAQVRGP
jgi:hypothetical protein